MKYLPLLFVVFSIFNSVHAQNLCDESCEFSATFPQGGNLEAVDELTLIFGTGGELNLGTGGTVNTAIQPSALDFSSGGTLNLAAGESITFGPDGSLVLGTGGNMDTGSYSLSTTGDILIEATGGSQSLHINGDLDVSGTLSFISNSLVVNSTITSHTQLNLENSGMVTLPGSVINMGTAIISAGTIGAVGAIETIQPGSLLLSSNSGVISNVVDPITSINNNAVITINPGSVQLLQNLDALNGMEIPTSDGGNCIVESPQCVADDGTIYVLSDDSKLVKKESSADTSTDGASGSFGFPLLGFLMIFLFFSGYREKLSY